MREAALPPSLAERALSQVSGRANREWGSVHACQATSSFSPARASRPRAAWHVSRQEERGAFRARAARRRARSAGSLDTRHPEHRRSARAGRGRCDAVRPWLDDLTVSHACPDCGSAGALVWFGEMPPAMDLIDRALRKAELFVAIGTSGAVYPAAGFVAEARAHGLRCCEINLEAADNADLFDEQRLGRQARRFLPGSRSSSGRDPHAYAARSDRAAWAIRIASMPICGNYPRAEGIAPQKKRPGFAVALPLTAALPTRLEHL